MKDISFNSQLRAVVSLPDISRADTVKLGGYNPEASEAATTSSKSFGDFLQEYISDINKEQAKADVAAVNLATGKYKNIHEAMIQMEKAALSFQLLVQVRNKALDAYQEMMRMQV